MEFLKTNYDRVLLIIAGLVLVGITAYTSAGLAGIRGEFPLPAAAPKGAPFQADPELKRLVLEAPRLREPAKSGWGEAEQALFVSRTYLLREGQMVDIKDSGEQLHEGIDNAWIIQYGMEGYTDPEFPNKDPDNDGFTNLEEFSEGTSPKDGTSLPPLWKKLRLKSFEKIPFRVKFMGAPSLRPGEPFAQDTEFSINTVDYSSPTQFLKVGQKIAGTELEITKAETKTVTNELGVAVDASELTLKDASTGDIIVLVNEKEVDSPYSYAILDNPVTGEEIRVEKGKTFALGPEEIAYKLVDVGSEGAVITPVQSEGQRLTVPPSAESKPPAPQNVQ